MTTALTLKSRITRFFFTTFAWIFKPWWMMNMFFTKVRGKKITYKGGPFTTWDEIAYALQRGDRWSSDPLGGIVDYAGHPSRMQDRIEKDAEEFGDCEDHAMYWAAALLLFELADEVYIGSVQVQHRDGQAGHAVCVFRSGDAWYYADYRHPYTIMSKWAFGVHYANTYDVGVPLCTYLVQVTKSKADGTLTLGKWAKNGPVD